MKRLIPVAFSLALFLPLFPGCAYMRSSTTRTMDSTTGIPTEKTRMAVYTLFDANSSLAKFSNRSGYTTNGTWGPGTYVGTINESSSTTTNFNDLVGTIVNAAVKAAVKP